MKNRGLILEGGAMRGMYIAGVVDILLENEIDFNHTVGVSAGAAFGCNIKSKQIGRAIAYSKEFSKDPRYVGIKSLLTTGDLYNAKFVFETVPTKYYPFDLDTYRLNPMRFTAVVTDIVSGEAIYKDLNSLDESDIKWLRASTSMPLAAKIVEIGDRKYLDGGMSDPIPVKWMLSHGYEKNVIVLTQVENYRKSASNSLVFKLGLAKYPWISKLMKVRHTKYNQTLEYISQMEQAGNLFVIRPSIDLGIKRVEKDPEKLEAMYQLGKSDALSKLSDLVAYLEH